MSFLIHSRPLPTRTRVSKGSNSMPAVAALRRELRLLRSTMAEQGRILSRAVTDLEVQFKRIAQIQAEVDELRKGTRREP